MPGVEVCPERMLAVSGSLKPRRELLRGEREPSSPSEGTTAGEVNGEVKGWLYSMGGAGRGEAIDSASSDMLLAGSDAVAQASGRTMASERPPSIAAAVWSRKAASRLRFSRSSGPRSSWPLVEVEKFDSVGDSRSDGMSRPYPLGAELSVDSIDMSETTDGRRVLSTGGPREVPGEKVPGL